MGNENLAETVKEAVVAGMTEVLGPLLNGDMKDDTSLVGVSRIGEADKQFFTRPPTPYVDFDTNNLRSLLNLYDSSAEVTRNEIITAAQEMTAAQSRGALKALRKQIEDAFTRMSVGLDAAAESNRLD